MLHNDINKFKGEDTKKNASRQHWFFCELGRRNKYEHL